MKKFFELLYCRNEGQKVETEMVRSYLLFRTILGVIGLLLPAILYLGNRWIFHVTELMPSLSGYHATDMRDVLSGSMFVVAAFLFVYRGYQGAGDNWWANFGSLFALGVALFPSVCPGHPRIETAHAVSAVLLFSVFIVFSLVYFPRYSEDGQLRGGKLAKRIVYVASGLVMVVCLVWMGIGWFTDNDGMIRGKYYFWLESAALVAFGLSWFVKGLDYWGLVTTRAKKAFKAWREKGRSGRD